MTLYLVQLLDGGHVVRRLFFPVDPQTSPVTLVQLTLAKLWQNDPFTDTFPDSASVHRVSQPKARGAAEIEEVAVVELDAEFVFDGLLRRQNRLLQLQLTQRQDSLYSTVAEAA